MHKLLSLTLVLGSVVGCGPTERTNAPDQAKVYKQVAEQKGWLADYRRGQEILRKLSGLGPDAAKALDVAAYRQERITLVGGTAPPGGTNDLITAGGFYLRVVNKAGKDLRPHAAWWEVLVRGQVLQVLPENKVIVLEVDEDCWVVLQTG